jgi:hypothetical protein
MGKQIPTILRRLRSLEARRSQILAALAADEPLLVGGLSLVKRTCGKSTCHCANAPGHPAWMLATSRDGRRRCQVVRQADVDAVQRRVEEHRAFTRGLRELQALHREEIDLLRGLQEKRNVPYD